jgi:TolA-binding protein
MRKIWIILALAAAAAVSALAQETDSEEPLSTAKLTIEESGRLLATGRAAYEDGLYRLARRRLEELVTGAPDRRRQVEGALWLARVLRAEKKPAEALSVLNAYADQVRAAPLAAEFAWVEAQTCFDLGQLAETKAGLEEFRDKYAGQESAPSALQLLAQVAIAQRDWAAAQDTCGLIESRHPGRPEAPLAWLDLAAALAAADRPEDARAALAHVETNYAGQVWGERAALRTIELQLAQPERPQALKRLQKMAANTNLMGETRAQGYQIVAQALGAESNYVAALEMIERGLAVSGDPARRLESQVVKARLLMQAGRVEEGANLMRSAAAQMPDEIRAARLQLDLAEGLAQLGAWTEAAAEFQSWLDAFDGAAGTADALSGCGWALWSVGRYEEAAQMFRRAVGAETDSGRRLPLLLKLADSQFAGGQCTEAKASYAAVLAVAPAGGEFAGRAQLQLAETELALGEDEAGEIRLLDLSRAKNESEFSRSATMRLGSLYEDRGAFETAIEQYGRLVDSCSDPETCAAALLARGLIRYRIGAFPPALDDFLRIRDQLPQTKAAAQATVMRGWCLYLLGKDAEALQVCEQFLADFPESEFAPDVRFWLGEHAFNGGDYEKAEQGFASVAIDHPASPRAADALFWAGRAATARRAYLAANEHYNALMAGYPDSPRIAETLLAQGDVLSELGQFAAAILAFNEVIVKFAQQPEALIAWGRKGDCQYTLGQDTPARYEEALLSYRTLLDFAGAPVDLRLQAGFKIGRCLEKMGRSAAALDRYMEVVYSFLQENQPPAEAGVWFTRAAFGAAALQESAGNWKEAAGIYSRVADSGTASATEARDRMMRIRQEHWVAF